jgi:hypothetical protein
MSERQLHEIKNLLHRLELMAKLLASKDFQTFSENEIREDVKNDLARLAKHFSEIGN